MNTTVKTLKKDIEDGATAAMNTANHAVKTAKNTARALASDAADSAAALQDRAVEELDDARDALSDSGDRLAATLRRAITEPAPDSVQARVMSAVAGGVSQAAHTLRDRSLSEMAADLRALAKRNPGVFAAGAAVAGFALARFLRASATSRHSDTPS